MRILILSCNTGQGHNSAAAAIKDYFESNGISCDIKDSLAFWSPENSKLICKGHIFIYRNLPKLFGFGYGLQEKIHLKDGETSMMYDLVTKGCEALLQDLKASCYDCVICTHLFSAMMMTKLRRNGFMLPTYFVCTDYTSYPGISEISPDGYFISHKDLINEFEKNGIDRRLLIPSGIPVNPSFYNSIDKTEARSRLHLPENKRIVLMMCGSMGCGPMKNLTNILSKMLPEDSHIVVICGSNRKLYNSIAGNITTDNVTVVGYTTRVPLYMDAADLILTKPGGLSATEAAIKNLPMVFIDAVPGCETKNLNFFIGKSFAATAETQQALAATVCYMLYSPERLKDIRQKLKEHFSGCAVQEIYEHITKETLTNAGSKL